MTLTDEQREPLSHARSPQQAAGHRHIVVATVAGPGSGKTTMQEGLAAELCAKGHERVCKLFFNRKAADDGFARLQVQRAVTHQAHKAFHQRCVSEQVRTMRSLVRGGVDDSYVARVQRQSPMQRRTREVSLRS